MMNKQRRPRSRLYLSVREGVSVYFNNIERKYLLHYLLHYLLLFLSLYQSPLQSPV